MSKKGKPVHGGNREREEMEKAATANAATSRLDFTTTGGVIASVLSGSEKHITARELARTIGVSDPRRVTKMIEKTRQSGQAPICASNGEDYGYYLPSTIGELDTYIRSLSRRHKSLTATLTGMMRARDAWAGQMSLDLDEQEAEI